MTKGLRVKIPDLDALMQSKIDAACGKGLYEAAALVRSAAVQITPMDRGILRSSAYIERRGNTKMAVGFAAPYAHHVHESPGKLKGKPRRNGRGRYWDGGEPKFLHKALDAVSNDAVGAIIDAVREARWRG